MTQAGIRIKDPTDISNHFDFLFTSVDQSESTTASIWLTYYRSKKTKSISSKKGYIIPPPFAPVFHTVRVPILGVPGELIDVKLFFEVGGLKYIELLDIPILDELYTVFDLFQMAIAAAGGEIEEGESLKGYVSKQFKNQTEPKTYEVTKHPSGLLEVKALEYNNNKANWKPQNLKSPRTLSVIAKFKKELKNGTLQTEFTN